MPQTLPSVKSSLVIVESPAKCNKIEQFLGPGYKCIATFGHIQELKDLKDIDISNKFTPSFTPAPSKSQQIAKLRKAIRESKEVLIATTMIGKVKELLGMYALYSNCHSLPNALYFMRLQSQPFSML